MKMKIIALIALSLCVIGAVCVSSGDEVSAGESGGDIALVVDGEVTKTYDDLATAVTENKETKYTLVLLDDITVSSQVIINYSTTDCTLDLNGHDIELARGIDFYFTGGTFTIKGEGKITQVTGTYVESDSILVKSATNGGQITIGESVVIEGVSPFFFNRIDSVNACKVNVDFYGTAITVRSTDGYYGAGFYVNGTITNTVSCPTINIHPGAIINGNAGEGIYAAGYAKWTIDGATITGGTAMEIRAGTLSTTDSTFIGTASETTVIPNGNGSTTDGAGIAVAQHNTNLAISVTVDSCDVRAATPFNEANPQGNTPYANVSIAINSGTFTVTGDGEKAVNSSSGLTGFVYGGQFSTSPAASYIATGKAVSKIDGMYCVATPVETSPSGTVDSTTDSVIADVGRSSQVQVNLPYAKVSISGDASLNSIMVSAESKQFREAPNAVASYEITIVSSTSYVADITVSANIPYGQQAIVYYINGAGQLVPVEVVSYTYDSVTFRTNHTTPFVVMTESSSYIPGSGGDEDDYPFPPWNGSNQGTATTTSDSSDDNTKVIAAAAAVIVIMLAAVAMMVSKKN